MAPPPHAPTTQSTRSSRRSRYAFVALVLLLLSAIPLAAIIAWELRATSNPSTVEYRSLGWLRECAKWDATSRRFLVSTFFDGWISEVAVREGEPANERRVVVDADVAGNSSLGISIDHARERVLVVYADVIGNRYSAVAAYDLATWERLFLTRLAGQGDEEPSYADDVAIDSHGNAYITDVKGSKIWKVDVRGQLLSTIKSKAFKPRPERYYNLIGLNGIEYHPGGYLLVIHTSSGALLKVDTATEEVSEVKVSGGSLLMGDGISLVGPSKLVVAGSLSTVLLESEDEWVTARVVGRYFGAMHRVASAVTVVEGKVYVSHMVGGGLRKRSHVITEAVFSPL